MSVQEVLDTLYEAYGGLSKRGRRGCAFAMHPRATKFDHIKVALAFSYDAENTPEGKFFTTMGTPITIVFNELTGRSITLPHHLFPMKTYDPVEVDTLLGEVSNALDEIF